MILPGLPLGGLLQEEFTFEPIGFREQIATPACLTHLERFGDQAQALCDLTGIPCGLGEQR